MDRRLRTNRPVGSVDNNVVVPQVPLQSASPPAPRSTGGAPPAPPVARPVASAPIAPPTDAPTARAAPSAHASPFTPEHLRQLELARRRGRKIRRAAVVATFHGWSFAVFAALSLLIGLFSVTSLLVGMALAVVAYNEFAGAKLLRQLDLRGPRRLGFNQLGLCAVLVIYASWSICGTLTGPSPLDDALAAAGGQPVPIVAALDRLQTVVALALYGGLIVGSLIAQGATAWYYFSRAPHIRAHVAETPQWVLELERTSGWGN